MAPAKKRIEYIKVAKPALAGNDTLVCKFECSRGIESVFRTDAFVATYESADLSQVPDSLLVIPLLANLAPIAWVLDLTVYVPTLDPLFLDSLQKVKDAFRRMHPRASWSGSIVPDVLDAPAAYPARKPALLFSGGIDSLASYLVHRDEDPLLVTALGKAPASELTGDVKEQLRICRDFAGRHGARFTPVTTNLNRFLAPRSLPFGTGWWQKVQHGLAFLSLCAPLSRLESISTVYLSSTHSEGSNIPWGSHPSVDNNVAWASTVAAHDCYHLSRQQKVALIAEFIRTEDPGLRVQICRRGAHYGNCSRCGKCCRTMIGLAVAGVNPNLHGFRLDGQTLTHIRAQLSRRIFLKSANNRFMWQDIQQHLPDRSDVEIEGLGDFLRWFRDFEVC